MKRKSLKPITPLGQFVLKRMADLGLRQADIARRSEMPPSGIDRLLHNGIRKPQPHSHVVERLAGALEVPIGDITKFFDRNESGKLDKGSSLVAGSEKVVVLLRTIELISGKPARDYLDQNGLLEKWLVSVIKDLLNKEGKEE